MSRNTKYSRNPSRPNADGTFDDFKCVHCGRQVPFNPRLSGVQNRNHCPYCLYSRHLDHAEAGDRLSPCMGPMRPVGMTLKKVKKKYASPGQGELMLIHECATCGRLSINRIAADDYTEELMAVYDASLNMDESLCTRLAKDGIQPLGGDDRSTVRRQLFGETGEERQ